MALYMKRQSQQGNKVFASSSKQSTQPNVSKMFNVRPNSGPSEVVHNDPNTKKKKKTRGLPASWNESAQPNVSKKVKAPANDIPTGEEILNELEVEEDRMFSSSENENPNHQKKNNTRGPTRGLDTVKLAAAMGKEKLPIKIDVMQGRPTNGVQSAKLSSELGLISREYLDEIPIR
ncbi:unnamed protein product [Linum trigynum]|uniref:Uncharacterized protein n=2 Tax=Linum trigynum TaxID=586398 RepID=A0AAV2F9L8_9ROSI